MSADTWSYTIEPDPGVQPPNITTTTLANRVWGTYFTTTLQATDGTEEIFQKAGDIKRQGIAVSNRAAALEGLKKWNEALAEYDRAASLFEQIGEGDMHSVVRKAAANINLKRGRIVDSQMDVYDSLRLVEKPSLTQRFMKFLMRIGLVK
jgi:hypothetical protein